MNFLGILKGAAAFALNLFGVIKKTETPTLSDLLPTIISNLLPAVEQAMAFQNLTTKDQVDAFLADFDAATGVEATAVDVLKDMTPEAEEQLWDAVGTIVRCFAYTKIGVEGYKQPTA